MDIWLLLCLPDTSNVYCFLLVFVFFNPSMQTRTCGIYFIYLFIFFLFIFRVSRMCYQMISDELTTTPLGTETAQNHFSTKAERMLLVTNATEYLSGVCVCVFVYICMFMCLSVCVSVCVLLLSGERIKRGHRIPDHTLARRRKSHLLTMYCCDTRICTNVKS